MESCSFRRGSQRAAVAIDGATGETLWTYSLDEGERGDRTPRNNNRGVAYWADERGNGRVLMITRGYQLVALDAKTGVPVKDFGSNGLVDLWVGLLEGTGRKVEIGQIGASSPAIVVGDVVVVGAALLSGGAPPSKTNVPAYVRGYSARTGKLLWTFHTIPRLGEFGNDTWKNDSWQYTGNTAVWAPMAADRGTWLCLSAGRRAHRRLLRRAPAWRQPVRQYLGLPECENRGTHLALPVGPS